MHKFWEIFFLCIMFLKKKISTISFHISFTIWKRKLSRIKMKILIGESTTFSISPTFCQLMDKEIFLNVNLIYISKELMDLFLIQHFYFFIFILLDTRIEKTPPFYLCIMSIVLLMSTFSLRFFEYTVQYTLCLK